MAPQPTSSRGRIPASQLRWDVRVFTSITSTSWAVSRTARELALKAITDHDADAHYEVTMTATDDGGLSAQATVELSPETTTVRLDSSPAGARRLIRRP